MQMEYASHALQPAESLSVVTTTTVVPWQAVKPTMQVDSVLHVPLLVDYIPTVPALIVAVYRTVTPMMQVMSASHALQPAQRFSVVTRTTVVVS